MGEWELWPRGRRFMEETAVKVVLWLKKRTETQTDVICYGWSAAIRRGRRVCGGCIFSRRRGVFLISCFCFLFFFFVIQW